VLANVGAVAQPVAATASSGSSRQGPNGSARYPADTKPLGRLPRGPTLSLWVIRSEPLFALTLAILLTGLRSNTYGRRSNRESDPNSTIEPTPTPTEVPTPSPTLEPTGAPTPVQTAKASPDDKTSLASSS